MDDTIRLALETIEQGKQAIVFVASRASAEKTAEDIAKLRRGTDPRLQEIAYAAETTLSAPTKQCIRLSKILKSGIAFHHAGLANKQKEMIEEEFRKGTIKIICATPTLAAGLSLPVFRVIIKSLKRFSGKWGMDWIPVLEYLQMAGRAGRPEYEKFGEAIAIAKSEKAKEEIYKRYILGEPEDIYSKLAVEPVLRTYLLSLISSGIIKDEKEMKEFFKQTFWAAQFNDFEKLEEIMEKMLSLLHEWEFVRVLEEDAKETRKENNTQESKKEKAEQKKEKIKQAKSKDILSEFTIASNLLKKLRREKGIPEPENNFSTDQKQKNQNRKLKATLIGRRISQLYLDPLTAKHIIDCLNTAQELQGRNEGAEGTEGGTSSFSYLQMISNTLEMRPLLRIKKSGDDKQRAQTALLSHYEELLSPEPEVYDIDYYDYMNSIKTTLFFEEWIDEKREDYLFDQFSIRPGEIRVKLENADWLLYAADELAVLLGFKEVGKELKQLRARVKVGARKELLVLLKVKGIGRSRARTLYNNGVKSLGDLKAIDLASLAQSVGPKTAVEIKEQLGQEVKEVPKGKRKGQLSLGKF